MSCMGGIPGRHNRQSWEAIFSAAPPGLSPQTKRRMLSSSGSVPAVMFNNSTFSIGDLADIARMRSCSLAASHRKHAVAAVYACQISCVRLCPHDLTACFLRSADVRPLTTRHCCTGTCAAVQVQQTPCTPVLEALSSLKAGRIHSMNSGQDSSPGQVGHLPDRTPAHTLVYTASLISLMRHHLETVK